jgi:Glycosyltransferase family 28 N-terminal domain
MNSETSTRNESTRSLLSDIESLFSTTSSTSGEHTPPASEAGITTPIDHELSVTALAYSTENESGNGDGDGDGPLPPPYSEPNMAEPSERDFDAHAHLTADGHADGGSSHKALGFSEIQLKTQPRVASKVQRDDPPKYVEKALLGKDQGPPLSVVMHVVGLYSDIQPFIALANVLKTTYGYRVRLATHPCFKGLVEENNLEFFSIGGDPSKLTEFLTKNTNQMSSVLSFDMGSDTSKWRAGMQEIINNCWRSCVEPSPPGTTDSMDSPFVADVIIANPPSFAHIHCAEKLGIPLHLMST